MRLKTSQILLILLFISLTLLCVFPISALEFSEEKIIFVSDDTAFPYYAIDSGNIFIMDHYVDKYISKNEEWSKLYFYNISTDKLTELTFDDMSNTKVDTPIAISGNTVYWTINSDLLSYDTATKSYKKIFLPSSVPINLAVQGKTIALVATRFPGDIDGPDICISTDGGENFKRYRLPGHQEGMKMSGNILVYKDSRSSHSSNTLNYLDIDTWESYQIGDETKGLYTSPDISGSNIVYRFDSDIYSFLKDDKDKKQELHMIDISTNTTSLIASPNARIFAFAIDKDYIVWCDNRNKSGAKICLYDLKENKEYSVADIDAGTSPQVSKNTIAWVDSVDNRNVLKIVTIHDDNYVDDDISGNSGKDNTDNSENSQSQQTSPQTASGEIVCIIISVGIALIVKAGYHGRKNN